MKRKITFSIALFLSIVLVALMSSDRAAQAQNQLKVIADTGIVTLGPNQVLRIVATDLDSGNNVRVRFKRMEYMQGVCNDGVCKLAASSQTTSDVITMQPGEAAYIDFRDALLTEFRGVVLSNSRNVRVNAMIIDSTTGEIVTSWATFPSS